MGASIDHFAAKYSDPVAPSESALCFTIGQAYNNYFALRGYATYDLLNGDTAREMPLVPRPPR